MAKKHVFLVSSLIVIAAVAGYGLFLYKPFNSFSLFSNNQDQIVQNVVALYKLTNPGANVSAVKVDEVSGVYKILLKAVDPTGTVSYKETYVTKDGALLTENFIFVNASISQITRINNFVDCLSSKQVMIFGLNNQTATLLQFNILGGGYATKLYASCDGGLAQQCVNVGITQVPSVVYNKAIYPGVQQMQFFQNLTSCVY